MAPKQTRSVLLQGAFLLPFLISSLSAFPSFPYNTNANANSKAVDINLNQLKPRPHFPTLLKRQNTTFGAADIDDDDDDDDTPSITGVISGPGTRLGCYRDNSATSRLLPTSFTASDTLTVESCAIFCGPSSAYFGIEYGRECWCASSTSGFSPTSPSTLAARVDDDECDFEYAGNDDQTCGASERIEVYTNVLYRPPGVADVRGFEALGCYRESSPRVLPNSLLGDDALTAAKCAAYCTNLNFPYFGLKYGRECWCGVSPPFDSQRVPDSDAARECNMPCAGNPSEICGAANRITVYGREMIEKPPKVGNYVYHGCYTDSPVTGEKSLTGKVTYDATMTLDKCRLSCEEDGYPYFGTEYGSQCFCGTRLYDQDANDDEDNYPARALLVADRQCSMRCVGDATNATICGDANRLSVYWNGDDSEARNLGPLDFAALDPPLLGWNYGGCVRDDVVRRTLTGARRVRNDMTMTSCVQYCNTGGYRYAGLEFQSECYCGNTLNGDADEVDDSQCEELCSGDSEEFCGGPSRLSLYERLV
ncbi:WSC domain-containing protein [Pseudoneurospora amorphoporcata]|uniref:WSC domain-containing protein n=1 Tax=Pseudoneurospora amorphoporcata TaxID=241081 RepID=A0AAN6SJD8_9PEZI|nr:WSC domain-containing protein [Pseudoneurospora amorphoporcata]